MHRCDYEIIPMGGAESSFSDRDVIDQVKKVAEDSGVFLTIQERGLLAGREDCTYFMNRVRACGGKSSYMARGTKI